MTIKKNIKEKWSAMPASKRDGEYYLNNYKNNLYLLKDSKDNFGFCVTGIYNYDKKFKNLEIKNKPKLTCHKSKIKYLNCALITAKEKIVSNLLFSKKKSKSKDKKKTKNNYYKTHYSKKGF